MTRREIIICKDGDELNRNAAAQFIALGGDAIARSGRFAVALSGGSTPAALYSLLASVDFRDRVDWPRVHFFWGDERCVPPDHPDSNFRMAQENLLARIQLPATNIHRILGEQEPRQAVTAYEAELKNFFGAGGGALPRFDLILLGLGDDGHTASLFPGSSALAETERLVTAVYIEKLRSHRLTLTLPVINAAAQVVFLVSGKSKKAIVSEVLGSDRASSRYPAATVRPSDGSLTWLITADAAEDLPPSMLKALGAPA